MLALVAVLSLQSPADAACETEQGVANTVLGFHFEPHTGTLEANGRSEIVVNPFPQQEISYLRLKLSAEDSAEQRWSMVFRNRAGQVLLAITDQDGCATTCWTPRLSTDTVRVELTGDAGVRFRISDAVALLGAGSQTMYSPNPDAPYEPLFSANFSSTDERNRASRLSDNVGMFVTGGEDAGPKTVSWCCSGVLVSDSLFLTNWHCGAAAGREDAAFWTAGADDHPSCANGFVDFSWDGDDVRREFACQGVEWTNKALDYALIRLEPILGTTGKPMIGAPVAVSAKNPGLYDRLTIIHHAECRPKLLSRNCRVVGTDVPNWAGDALEPEFGHNCSTEGGSSGAPVFNTEFELLGLHHLGHGCDDVDPMNKAIPIGAILKDIGDATELESEIILQRPD